MNTHDKYELPPLPNEDGYTSGPISDGGLDPRNEADRQARGEPVAYIRTISFENGEVQRDLVWVSEAGDLSRYRDFVSFEPLCLVVPQPDEPANVPSDEFRGDNVALASNIRALLDLDAKGALVPHGVGGLARTLLSAAASRLSQPAQPAASAEQIDKLSLTVAGKICRHLDTALDQSKVQAAAYDIAYHFAAPVVAQPIVPEPLKYGGKWKDHYVTGWNNCRAAMLEAAPELMPKKETFK